jgi:hypothetical protein
MNCPEPIPELWAQLLRSLNRAQTRRWDADAGFREKAIARGMRGIKKPSRLSCRVPITVPTNTPAATVNVCSIASDAAWPREI